VWEMQRGRLRERIRWPARDGRNRMPNNSGGAPNGVNADRSQRHALDWRAVQVQLNLVTRRWDLGILCNLHEDAGRRPADLLAAINSQAGAGRQLSSQVLSGRLRELEQDGYVRHEDLSVMPLHRVYYLQPPGQVLISDLARLIRPGRPTLTGHAAGDPAVTAQ
jgi:DNA-binding HxlR family transcriptional regulator